MTNLYKSNSLTDGGAWCWPSKWLEAAVDIGVMEPPPHPNGPYKLKSSVSIETLGEFLSAIYQLGKEDALTDRTDY